MTSSPRGSFARQVLLGSRLEDKLASPGPEVLAPRNRAPAEALREDQIPGFPGRPPQLAPSPAPDPARPDTTFPGPSKLESPRQRGKVLHFFANHELLALELMALAVLRFPEAPEAFQQGLLRTLAEEQSHLKLYLERMQELGVGFGELPVSSYFWNCMRGARSPLELITQLSLTFEQANLDYSLLYMEALAKAGDDATAAILARVHAEEIGHVGHGLAWFNRWREDPGETGLGTVSRVVESDWDAYRRHLPPPMTPGRARGPGYCVAARRQAGLSERFISELEICSASRGRLPTLWRFDPFCEARIAHGRPGMTPGGAATRLSRDLETLPLFLASPGDLVEVSGIPDSSWLRTIWEAGYPVPEWVCKERPLQRTRLGGFEPWGWCPESHSRFRSLLPALGDVGQSAGGAELSCHKGWLGTEKYADTRIGRIFSKSFAQDFARQWLREQLSPAEREWISADSGETVTTLAEALELIRSLRGRDAGQGVALKAPFGTAGMQVQRVRPSEPDRRDDLEDESLLGWMRQVLATQGGLVIEPWLRKRRELSMQLRIGPKNTRYLPLRSFLAGPRGEYQGALLGRKLSAHFGSEELALLQAALPIWKRLAGDLGCALREAGYQGPAGVDAMIHETGEGRLLLRPLQELNPRWTLGSVALAIEERLAPGATATWLLVPVRKLSTLLRICEPISPMRAVELLRERFPLEVSKRGIEAGILATQDPSSASEVLTLLFVGRAAMDAAASVLR